MGILSDFFVASPVDVALDRLHRGPVGIYPTVSATSITTLELALLLQIVQNADPNDAVDRLDEFSEVTIYGENGPWVYRISNALRDALTTASAEDIAGYVARWLETEELAGSDPSALIWLLSELSGLARQAQSGGNALYLWICL